MSRDAFRRRANKESTGFLLKNVDSDQMTMIVRATSSNESSLSMYFLKMHRYIHSGGVGNGISGVEIKVRGRHWYLGKNLGVWFRY